MSQPVNWLGDKSQPVDINIQLVHFGTAVILGQSTKKVSTAVLLIALLILKSQINLLLRSVWPAIVWHDHIYEYLCIIVIIFSIYITALRLYGIPIFKLRNKEIWTVYWVLLLRLLFIKNFSSPDFWELISFCLI